jgi:aminopeptidase N
MKKLTFLILSAVLLQGCGFFKYHYFGQVPEKPGHYPRFTERDTIYGKLDDLRAGYDVTYYDIDINVNPGKERIDGMVTVYFRAQNDTDKIRIDLYENLKISSLEFEGQTVPFTRNYRAVTVVLPYDLITGQDYSLKVTYSGKPEIAKNPPWKGGMVWKKDKSGDPWVGVTCETEGGSIWFPCKDHLSDEPDSVRIKVTVPEGLKVVSNGIMVSHEKSSGHESFTWETHYPINIYNITFYVGNFEHFSDTLQTKEGILDLDYYVLPENLDTAKNHFRQTKDVLSLYSRLYGPYPWIKEGFKLVEAPFEGMEHQTAIAYGSGYKNSPSNGGDYIIIHESAHEWWGNAVTVSDYSDIWLQEGFATYSEFLFIEHKLGYEKMLNYINWWTVPWINNKLPVVGPKDVSYWDHLDNDVYSKGAMILHTLRNTINNDRLFFDIIQTFYSEHAIKSHPVSADFIEVVERKTGQKWDKFFEAYLNQRETPLLEWYFGTIDDNPVTSLNNAKPRSFIVAKWKRVPEGFTMPVTFYSPDTKSLYTIKVTTKALIFFLPEERNYTKLKCNPKSSYFENYINKQVIYEVKKNSE